MNDLLTGVIYFIDCQYSSSSMYNIDICLGKNVTNYNEFIIKFAST